MGCKVESCQCCQSVCWQRAFKGAPQLPLQQAAGCRDWQQHGLADAAGGNRVERGVVSLRNYAAQQACNTSSPRCSPTLCHLLVDNALIPSSPPPAILQRAYILQLGSSPPTCMSALSNACSVNLPPKHERWHLQLVLKDVTKRRSLVAKLSAEDRTELLDKSENVAFLLDALAVYMSCHYGTDLRMRAFLKGFKNDTMVLEVRLNVLMVLGNRARE